MHLPIASYQEEHTVVKRRNSAYLHYRSESLRKLCVAYNNVFRKITFLPRDCSVSLIFATRDLPTCNILIRKHAYGLHISELSSAESRNVILQFIVCTHPF